MNAKLRPWHTIAIVVGAAGGWWLWYLLGTPSPPDLVGQGFTSAYLTIWKPGDFDPDITTSTTAPGVVEALAELVRSSQPVVNCRCVGIGSLEFRHPDGRAVKLILVPAHRPEVVEFVAGNGRYVIDLARFLDTAAPFGVAATRYTGEYNRRYILSRTYMRSRTPATP